MQERMVAVVRHGKAEPDSETGLDRDRPLRPKGEAQSRWLGERLADMLEPRGTPIVVASPARRADETARLIAEVLGVEVAYDDRLMVDAPASGVLDLIASHAATALVLVGHNPQVSRLVGVLWGGTSAQGPAMRTGEVAVLTGRAGSPPGARHLTETLRLASD
ncbi:MAG: histidine phosphatase family protein [Planctomycetota bacterium]